MGAPVGWLRDGPGGGDVEGETEAARAAREAMGRREFRGRPGPPTPGFGPGIADCWRRRG